MVIYDRDIYSPEFMALFLTLSCLHLNIQYRMGSINFHVLGYETVVSLMTP